MTDVWVNCIPHKCKVILPHERNVDATGCDPSFVWRYIIGEATGYSYAPELRCSVCGENVWQERIDG